jgi:cytochrome bd-type quinol oxidase subunit 2
MNKFIYFWIAFFVILSVSLFYISKKQKSTRQRMGYIFVLFAIYLTIPFVAILIYPEITFRETLTAKYTIINTIGAICMLSFVVVSNIFCNKEKKKEPDKHQDEM